MGAVLFTLLVQGLSIEALVKKLGLDVPEFPDLLAEKEGALRAKEGSLASVGRLEKGGFFLSGSPPACAARQSKPSHRPRPKLTC